MSPPQRTARSYANPYVSLDFSFNSLSNQCSPDRRTTRDRSYRIRRYDEATSIVSAMATMAKNAVLQKACSRLIYQCTRLDKIIVRLRVPCALLGISLSRNSRKDESLPHGKYARRYLVFVSLRCRSTGRFCKADTHFTASLILETAT